MKFRKDLRTLIDKRAQQKNLWLFRFASKQNKEQLRKRNLEKTKPTD
jgi:hypothetical protein